MNIFLHNNVSEQNIPIHFDQNPSGSIYMKRLLVKFICTFLNLFYKSLCPFILRNLLHFYTVIHFIIKCYLAHIFNSADLKHQNKEALLYIKFDALLTL